MTIQTAIHCVLVGTLGTGDFVGSGGIGVFPIINPHCETITSSATLVLRGFFREFADSFVVTW